MKKKNWFSEMPAALGLVVCLPVVEQRLASISARIMRILTKETTTRR
jgi:hypothetical protein